MPTTEEPERQKGVEQHQREALNTLIGEQVLHTVGAPGNLLRVHVRPLWERNFRVNIFTGANAACARIANSYFVATDGDGNIIESTPKLTKQY